MGNILWTVIVVLVVLWLLGLVLEIGGGLIHALLVIAGIIFVFQLITGRRKL
ncbi:lmo0937 family membrane protein [Aerococcaceae bacterium WS4759]|uniref:Lmo0937 family membrane protein n=1 Tax=Fundicoccus ignavus TaxID=2664442 RepID=A0A6I2GK91_9LACT|nr:lmo0937 family membrane protein [Fundicoccus ignavus]MRI84998.1 lmo0937 family membrane protein [Fundicoccus ignavus]